MDWRRDGFVISTDAGRLDLDFTIDYLGQTYWGKDTPRDKLARSIDHALIFGLYREDGQKEGGENSRKDGGQVGFCRVVTDQARFAWLSDVFVLDELRGLGLGKWLVHCAVHHPDVADVSRFLLATKVAHGLYQQFGFKALDEPRKFMVKVHGRQ
jgi:GNAT superfamily N-acetyltransferase